MIRKIIDLSYRDNIERSVAIGFFDGVHIGHRELIDCMSDTRYRKCVLTFDSSLKGRSSSLLLTEKEKEEYFERLGVDEMLILPFDDKTKNSSVDDFLNFLRNIKAKKIVVGTDFTFGKDRSGTAFDLRRLNDSNIDVLPLLEEEGMKISTTLIRSLLKDKNIEKANRYLGYRFFYEGEVIHGKKNGRRIGYPTANFMLPEYKFVLPDCVYATLTYIGSNTYLSMTNIGNHPTIDALSHPIVETNIFDYSGDLYGQTIKVEFLSYIRSQVVFSSLDELKSQLRKDKENINQRSALL